MSNSNPSESTRSQRREHAAADALRSLIRDTLLENFPLLQTEEIELPLNLSLKISGNDLDELTFDPPLIQQIREQAENHLLPREVFQAGSVYDFQTRQSCRPPDALAVFRGYDPMGHPQWSLVTDLLPDGLTLKVFSGKDLKRAQLAAYGKDDKSYNLLGQLITGPLPVPQAYQHLTNSPTFALSAQIVETRDSRAHFALKLNLLAGGLLPDELAEMLQEAPLNPVGLALQRLDLQVQQLEALALDAWKNQDTRAFNRDLKSVPTLLAACAQDLHPATQPRHPFPQAALAAAQAKDWFRDTQRQSWILIDQNQSAHAFSDEGQFLTSFSSDEKRIAQRLHSQRWEHKSPPADFLVK